MTPPNINADPSELEKFSALASKWWDPNSEFKPLHDINPLRLGWIQQQVSLNNQSVLDVGCGGGILAESMARVGAQVTGIDLAEASLSVARLHQLESQITNLNYQYISAEDLSLKTPEAFDVVTCLEMLEHVPDPKQTVAACAALCKPGGWLFFSTINRNPKSFLFAIVGAEYILKLLPKGTHRYDKFITPAELTHMAEASQLSLNAMTGMVYNPFTKVYKLNNDVSVNYIMAFQKPKTTGV